MKHISLFQIGFIGVLFLAACTSQNVPSESQNSSSEFPITSSSVSSQVSVLSSIIPQSEVERLSQFMIPNMIGEPVTFSASGPNLKIAKETKLATATITDLIEANVRGDTCNGPFTEEYIQTLLQAYDGKNSLHYTVFDPTRTLSPELFYITILPNSMNYKNKDTVKQYFDICAVGSQPLLFMNKKWLVFGNSACGGAADNGDQCNKTANMILKNVRFQ